MMCDFIVSLTTNYTIQSLFQAHSYFRITMEGAISKEAVVEVCLFHMTYLERSTTM